MFFVSSSPYIFTYIFTYIFNGLLLPLTIFACFADTHLEKCSALEFHGIEFHGIEFHGIEFHGMRSSALVF